MFRTKLFRMALVVTILAALVAVPMAVGAQMENGLDVAEGAVVSGTVDIAGYAAGDNFKRWDLHVFPGGDDNAKIWIASGADQGEFSVSVDTTQFPDGDHVLSLRVVNAITGNYMEYLVPFTIANAGTAPAVAETPAVETTEAVTETVAMTETVEAPAAAAPAPVATTNGLDVKEDASLVGTVDVTGYAAADNFKRWDLHVFPGGDDNAKIWLASGSDQGEFSAEVDTTQFPDGDHVLSLRIVDATTGNYMEYLVPVTVANEGAAPAEVETPAVEASTTVTETAAMTETVEAPVAAAPETTAMTNGFDVKEGAVVSGTVDLTGYAAADNFKRWDVHVFPGGDDNAKIWLASGTDQGEFSVTVDTTQYPDGDHVLSLRIVDANTGNYMEYLVPFTIDNSAA